MAIHIRRRAFICRFGGAVVAWPLAARAQQSKMPVVGYLSSFPADLNPRFTQSFRQGLNETGFFEGRNVAIEYRWDEEGRYDRLPVMASDLVERHVAVLFGPNSRGTRRQGDDCHHPNRVCDRQ
jgi:putative ABC transport system substrate-binding protein